MGNMDIPKNFPPKGMLKFKTGIALIKTSKMIAIASKLIVAIIFLVSNLFFISFPP